MKFVFWILGFICLPADAVRQDIWDLLFEICHRFVQNSPAEPECDPAGIFLETLYFISNNLRVITCLPAVNR